MSRSCCGICTSATAAPEDRRSEYGFYGGQSKQELLHEACRLLGVPTEPVGVGSSLPSHVFDEAARQAGVAGGSMPEVAERIAKKASLAWGPECDSRGSVSGGGSTVTREGLSVMVDALRGLLP